MVYSIYVLICPISNKVRYVGQTIQPLEKRLQAHLSEVKHRKSAKHIWLKELIQNGLRPIIKVKEVADTKKAADLIELGLIKKEERKGAYLTNKQINKFIIKNDRFGEIKSAKNYLKTFKRYD